VAGQVLQVDLALVFPDLAVDHLGVVGLRPAANVERADPRWRVGLKGGSERRFQRSVREPSARTGTHPLPGPGGRINASSQVLDTRACTRSRWPDRLHEQNWLSTYGTSSIHRTPQKVEAHAHVR
jgi:hypothetical protein